MEARAGELLTIPCTTQPRYGGKTAMLIDERAISQSNRSDLE
jgi:hypothetical protein